jgi:hypothetical protein
MPQRWPGKPRPSKERFMFPARVEPRSDSLTFGCAQLHLQRSKCPSPGLAEGTSGQVDDSGPRTCQRWRGMPRPRVKCAVPETPQSKHLDVPKWC